MSAETQSPSLSEENQLRLVLHLHNEGMFGVFEDPDDFITLKSKRVSPHYLDIRPGISDASTRELFANGMLDVAGIGSAYSFNGESRQKYDHIAGTPEAFTAYATTMADISSVNLLQPRVEQKDRGNKTPILGRFEVNDDVAVFDDVVTDGQTKIDTIYNLSEAGLRVAGYFVVMDRQEGGVPQVAEATGITITPALPVSQVVRMLRAEGELSVTQFDNVAEYLDQYGDPSTGEAMRSAL